MDSLPLADSRRPALVARQGPLLEPNPQHPARMVPQFGGLVLITSAGCNPRAGACEPTRSLSTLGSGLSCRCAPVCEKDEALEAVGHGEVLGESRIRGRRICSAGICCRLGLDGQVGHIPCPHVSGARNRPHRPAARNGQSHQQPQGEAAAPKDSFDVSDSPAELLRLLGYVVAVRLSHALDKCPGGRRVGRQGPKGRLVPGERLVPDQARVLVPCCNQTQQQVPVGSRLLHPCKVHFSPEGSCTERRAVGWDVGTTLRWLTKDSRSGQW